MTDQTIYHFEIIGDGLYGIAILKCIVLQSSSNFIIIINTINVAHVMK